MFRKPTHAATTSRHASPPNPFTREEPSPPRTYAPIDLTDSIYESDLLPERTSPLLQDRPAHGERRKLSGATKAPDPADGYQGPPANMKKPGAGLGMQPINTLNGNAVAVGTNPSYGRKKHTTYSSKGIGVQRHGGQEKYLERHSHKVATSPTHKASHQPPAKRRKTVNSHATPMDTVEITDDEDEVAPFARQEATPDPRSALPSRSPRSSTSWQSGKSPKRVSQPVSEFLVTSDQIAPKRSKPPRRKGANGHDTARRVSRAEVPFLGTGTLPQEQSIEIYEVDPNPRDLARVSILQSLKQGAKGSSAPDVSQRADGRVTSSHFKPENSRMHVNQSAKEDMAAAKHDRRAGVLARGPESGNNCRDVRPAAGAQDDAIEDSEDELSRPAAPRPNQERSPVKITQAKKTAHKQRTTTTESYSLDYARSYEIGPNVADLTLTHTENTRKFKINGRDSEGNAILLKMLDLASVTTVCSDNIRSMRLTGGLKDGNKYWCDLTFARTRDFNKFRSEYVDPEVVKQSAVTREKLEEVFRHPLKKNYKIGSTPMVSEALPPSEAHSEQGRTSRSRLIPGIKGISKELGRTPLSTPRLLARPLRSTRATAPLHDQDVNEEQEVEKYSVVHGLGKAWAKPLDHSVDKGFLKRRKATLDYRDLEKLDEGEFLNDSIMTFYMLYLYDQLKVSIDRVYFFNTYFFPTLTRKVKGREGINYDDVKSWTKRDDVFSYDYIVVPINENLHWYLAIICNVSNIQRKPAVRDLQDDSRDLDQITTSISTSDAAANPDSDANVAGQSDIGTAASAPDDVTETKEVDNDDANLFEEEKELDLIDRNAEVANVFKELVNQLDGPVEKKIQETDNMAALSATEASSIHPISASSPAKQAPKRKLKYRPGPPRKDPDKPVIIILDSLCGAHSNATRALREWLEAEGLEKRGMTVEIDNKGHYPKASQIPTQTNFSDCGLYVLGYLRKFFADPDEFRVKLLQMQMSAESDWPDMNPSKMREDIRNLIFQLNDARNDARKEAHKAKRTGSGQQKSASPTKSASKEASPALKQMDAANPQVSVAAKAVTELDPHPQDTSTEIPSPPTESRPRLRSPFAPEANSERARSIVAPDAREDAAIQTSSTAKESPNTVTKTSPLEPAQLPNKFTRSPEVRVPAKSPHIDLSAYERFGGASDTSRGPTRQSADLASPLQDRDMRVKDNRKLSMLSAKKAQASSPSRQSHKQQDSSSPLRARTRSGSHDDPITLDDSQDLDAPVRKRQSGKKAPLQIVDLDHSQESIQAPAQRSDLQAQSSPVRHRRTPPQGVKRDDSIREVIGGDEWRESNDVKRAIELSRLEEDERLRRLHGQGEQMEDVFDARAANSQSSHTVQEVADAHAPQPMELDDDDDDDQVIPESPLQRRSSPSEDVEMLD